MLLLLGLCSSQAFSQADFYAGKTITIIQDSSAGGVGHLRTNAVIASLKKYILGNPNIVVQFMEGAGGRKAANYLFNNLAAVVPYPPDLNEKMTKYLRDWGFEVASLVSLGTTFTESSIASVGDIYRAAKKAVKEADNPQGIFIPCANFPVVDVIEDIETDLGLPVIANTPSQLYSAFKAIGMKEKISGYGRLMRLL
jgi:maleate cis-trans isomerase